MIDVHHFHQEVIGCPTLRYMLEEAPAHGVWIGGAVAGAHRRISADEWHSMHQEQRVLVGVNSRARDMGNYWDAVRARKDSDD